MIVIAAAALMALCFTAASSCLYHFKFEAMFHSSRMPADDKRNRQRCLSYWLNTLSEEYFQPYK